MYLVYIGKCFTLEKERGLYNDNISSKQTGLYSRFKKYLLTSHALPHTVDLLSLVCNSVSDNVCDSDCELVPSITECQSIDYVHA